MKGDDAASVDAPTSNPDASTSRADASPRSPGSSGGVVSTPYPVQLRFSDTDRLGHVNNAVYATFAELGRLAFLRELGMTDKGLILAHLSIDFLRQVRLEDECAVVTRVVGVGNTSFELAQTLDANGEPAARFRAVIVCFDYATQRPIRVPDDFRRALLGGDGRSPSE
ncbi:MAG TPA: thioesterase family protein [Trueperaceae bacterium]|nr:thioesterase family protein [Trueperaceae bacterium]